MPKNRNHSLTNNFDFPLEFLKTLPYPEKVSKNPKQLNVTSVSELSFGEPAPLHDNCNNVKFENHSSATSSEYDIDIVSFGKSSSSSVSWSEEFNAEATQNVQNEFERMERVLQGKEPIPSHYNRDEYEQWIKTFPQLSISGSKMKCPIRQNQRNNSPNNADEEVFSIHSDMNYFLGDCDNDPTSKELKVINDQKNSVIDEVFKNISKKLFSNPAHNGKINNTKSKPKKDLAVQEPTDTKSNHLVSDFDQYLRISPVLLQESPKRSHHLEPRQESSHSVTKSEKLASRWMRDESLAYASLPYMSSAKNKSLKSIGHKNLTPNKARYPAQRNNYISLPPIKTSSLPSGHQYRSVSATPRQPPKGLSTIMIQAEPFLGLKKPQLKVSNNYLFQNDLEPWKKSVKHS